MIKRFRQYIKENELIQPRQKVLLTVSGGVDSVVLSKLFELSRFRFGIAHCNFHLRGEESDMDAQFVKKMAEQLKVPFFWLIFELLIGQKLIKFLFSKQRENCVINGLKI